MSKYITPEQYARAEDNDISARVVYARVKYHGWSIEEAITHPVGRPRKGVQYGARAATEDEWYYVAKRLGVKPTTYHKRLARGWSREKAATTPVETKFHPKRKKVKK